MRIIILLLTFALFACSSVGRAAETAAGSIVDCTIATGKAHADQYGPLVETVLRDSVRSDSTIDWAPVKAAAASFGAETGACALAAAVARLLAPPSTGGPQVSPLAVNPVSLRTGFEEIRRGRLGGRSYRTEQGVL